MALEAYSSISKETWLKTLGEFYCNIRTNKLLWGIPDNGSEIYFSKRNELKVAGPNAENEIWEKLSIEKCVNVMERLLPNCERLWEQKRMLDTLQISSKIDSLYKKITDAPDIFDALTNLDNGKNDITIRTMTEEKAQNY